MKISNMQMEAGSQQSYLKFSNSSFLEETIFLLFQHNVIAIFFVVVIVIPAFYSMFDQQTVKCTTVLIFILHKVRSMSSCKCPSLPQLKIYLTAWDSCSVLYNSRYLGNQDSVIVIHVLILIIYTLDFTIGMVLIKFVQSSYLEHTGDRMHHRFLPFF